MYGKQSLKKNNEIPNAVTDIDGIIPTHAIIFVLKLVNLLPTVYTILLKMCTIKRNV